MNQRLIGVFLIAVGVISLAAILGFLLSGENEEKEYIVIRVFEGKQINGSETCTWLELQDQCGIITYFSVNETKGLQPNDTVIVKMRYSFHKPEGELIGICKVQDPEKKEV